MRGLPSWNVQLLPTALKQPSLHMTQTYRVMAGAKEKLEKEKPKPTPVFRELQNHR